MTAEEKLKNDTPPSRQVLSSNMASLFITFVAGMIVAFVLQIVGVVDLSGYLDDIVVFGNHTEEYTVIVTATEAWQNSGVVLQAGDSVEIEYVSGEWRSIPYESLYGADGGNSHVCCSASCAEPLPCDPKGGLVGQIDADAPFFVGNYLQFTAQNDGPLQLRMNDIGTYDNEGSVTMSITVK